MNMFFIYCFHCSVNTVCVQEGRYRWWKISRFVFFDFREDEDFRRRGESSEFSFGNDIFGLVILAFV